jgi:hypothetical protein
MTANRRPFMPENDPVVIFTKSEGDEGYVIKLQRIANNDQLRLSIRGADETMNKATVFKLIDALRHQAEQMK